MKKKLLSLLVVVALVLSAVLVLTACGTKVDLGKGDTKITIWVSEKEGVKTLTEQQISAWLDGKEGYRDTYTFSVEGITEGEAATNMITDVASGADVYCFAQDQLARLIEANALTTLDTNAVKFVKDNNDAGSVNAATVNDKVYCYPITSDNGYFMYYDKSVVKAEHINDLAAIVADCKAASRNFSYELGGSAWYTASFFFATGCTSAWSFNDETNRWVAADNFNSDNGVIAMKGMQILTASGVWVDSSKALDFGAAIPSAVVVTGTWDSDTAKENLGDNYAVAKLPSFTVDGKTYQLGSYSGYKLMGVKPNSNATIQSVCHEVAQLLSGKDAQEARFDGFGWGPSNKAVQATDKVKGDAALTALAAQNAYAVPQGQIHGGWWDVAKLLGTATVDESGNAVDEAGLRDALAAYRTSLDKFESMSVEALSAWGIVGKIASLAGNKTDLAETQEEWANWGTDLAMVKSEGADGAEVWTSKIAVALTTGDEFKIRKGQGWDDQYGSADSTALVANTDTVAKAKTADGEGGNFTVAADGTYTIVLTIKDGVGTVKLVPAA